KNPPSAETPQAGDIMPEQTATSSRNAGRDHLGMTERHRRNPQQSVELERVQRQIAAIISAIKDGLRTPSMKQELLELEERKQTLSLGIKRIPAPLPRLHPRLADLYRERVERLHLELNRPELCAEAAE